jgi:hypothetical protein
MNPRPALAFVSLGIMEQRDIRDMAKSLCYNDIQTGLLIMRIV